MAADTLESAAPGIPSVSPLSAWLRAGPTPLGDATAADKAVLGSIAAAAGVCDEDVLLASAAACVGGDEGWLLFAAAAVAVLDEPLS